MTPANFLRRAFSVLARPVLITAGLGASVAFSQPSNVQLPAPAKGAAAITALGAHLPDVAKAYGLTSQQLVTLLQTQADLGVDRKGALLFACEGLAIAPGKSSLAKPGAANGAVADALTPNSSVTIIASGGSVDAFQLHSLPGVTRVIYLDFTGHTTSGTAWNSSGDIVSAPFDLDGDPTTFSATERSMIQKIWQRVAEDYAPFSVDVTTEDPGVEGLRRTTASDTAYGIRVVISPTNWYSASAGGVAYIGSFTASTDTPCFAFTQQLANGEKYIAEAVSHEVGHTLGLYHDGLGGSSPTGYYSGQGNWAPIMGVGYYKPLVQFSKGEYANANNTQDDLAVIATYVPVAADDHGNTLATASVLAGPTVADGGTIESRSDVDVFRFDTGAGAISLNLKGPGPDTNVDLKAELLDAAGQVIQTSDSSASLSAAINATLNAGTYYLRVSCVGLGDPVTTGYSSYGSIGNYLITGTLVPTGAKQSPLAAISTTSTSGTAPLTVNFSGVTSIDPDGTIVSYSWDFGTGASASGSTASYTYATPGTYTATLTVIDNDGLAGTASVTVTVNTPPNVPPVAAASANITSGLAPLAVTFSSVGSYDPDGSIASYSWNFGDGTSSASASPTKTYTLPGKYMAKLTVTDNLGSTATSSVDITAQSDTSYDVDLSGLVLTKNSSKAGTAVTASITVLDRMGRAVSGATVALQWSGLVAGTASAKTDASGHVTFTSQRTKKSGLETARVTSLTAPAGNVFDDSIYSTPLTQSIAVP
jgi:PKD repeat protein